MLQPEGPYNQRSLSGAICLRMVIALRTPSIGCGLLAWLLLGPVMLQFSSSMITLTIEDSLLRGVYEESTTSA